MFSFIFDESDGENNTLKEYCIIDWYSKTLFTHVNNIFDFRPLKPSCRITYPLPFYFILRYNILNLDLHNLLLCHLRNLF